MKKKNTLNSFKLGLFMIVGAFLLTILIFNLGTNDKLLKKKTRFSAIFKNVSGIKKGSDVRFSGVEIGTIDKIEMLSDTAIKVVMEVESKSAKFIRIDSKATIRTEGLVGGSYIAITPGNINSALITDGDFIPSTEAFTLDNMVATISETGNNAKNLTAKLEVIAEKLDKGDGTIAALLSDTSIKNQISGMVSDFKNTSRNTAKLTKEMMVIPEKVNTATEKFISVADSFQVVGENTIDASQKFDLFAENLNNKNNTIGKIVSDSVFAVKVEETLDSVDSTAKDVQATSEKVRGSFFIRIFNKNKDEKNN